MMIRTSREQGDNVSWSTVWQRKSVSVLMKQAPWPKACVEAKDGHFEYLQRQQNSDVPLLSFEW